MNRRDMLKLGLAAPLMELTPDEAKKVERRQQMYEKSISPRKDVLFTGMSGAYATTSSWRDYG